MPQTPEPFDVVVIAYNGLDMTLRALASIEICAPERHRIILVDNGSTDGTSALASTLKDKGHEYVHLPQNLGPYGAANAGIRVVSTEKFLFMCNDIALIPDSAEFLLEAVQDSTPVIGAAEYLSQDYDPLRILEAVEASGRRETRRFIEGAFFSCFAAKRSIYDKVGFFDESFALTFGDTDWEERYALMGYTYIRAAHAPVYHGYSVTRKRLGLEHDLRVDTADHVRFREKWKGHPDVLERHPLEDPEAKRRGTMANWETKGHL